MPTPKEGYRLKDGTKVPSVTTITGRFKESGGLLYWANQEGLAGRKMNERRDQAADVGTFIHAAVEAHLKVLPNPIFPEHFTANQKLQASDGIEAFFRWERLTRLKIVEQEMQMVSAKYRFGGTPDAIAMIDDELSLADWKSGKGIYTDAIIQCAAYLNLYQENHPDKKLKGIHIVRFGKDGGEFMHHYYPATHFKVMLAWRQFQLFREAYANDRLLNGKKND